MRTRHLIVTLFVVFSILFTACAPAPTGQQPLGPAAPGGEAAAPGGELPVPRNETIYMEDSATFRIFDSFNRFIPNGNDFANGFLQIGIEYLFYANFATGEIQPWLATEYTYNDDFTELTIKLRDDVKWNDGEPFSAEDIVFTVNMVKANPALSYGSSMQEFVADVSAPDATTERATSTRWGAFGESFTTSGFFVAFLTAAVIDPAASQSSPQAMPPAFTFGHEILSSIIGTSVASRSAAPST